MEYSLPHRITGEKDLKAYENYLSSGKLKFPEEEKEIAVCHQKPNAIAKLPESVNSGLPTRAYIPDTLTNPAFFQCYLKNNIGKLIRVESLIGQCLESRIGVLLEVGSDYIVIKLYRGCSSMMIHTADVKYITIVHNNDMNNMVY